MSSSLFQVPANGYLIATLVRVQAAGRVGSTLPPKLPSQRHALSDTSETVCCMRTTENPSTLDSLSSVLSTPHSSRAVSSKRRVVRRNGWAEVREWRSHRNRIRRAFVQTVADSHCVRASLSELSNACDMPSRTFLHSSALSERPPAIATQLFNIHSAASRSRESRLLGLSLSLWGDSPVKCVSSALNQVSAGSIC